MPQNMTWEPPFSEFLDLTPLRRGPCPTTGNTGLLCSGELFIESVEMFLARISVVFLFQAGSPPKRMTAKFKKCCVSIKIQAFEDWHSWDNYPTEIFGHVPFSYGLVGHSELASFLVLPLDKSCLWGVAQGCLWRYFLSVLVSKLWRTVLFSLHGQQAAEKFLSQWIYRW